MSDFFTHLAAPGVQGLRPYEPGKPLSELQREYGLSEAIKLASNENPLGPSPKAIAAIQSQLDQLALYPDGNGFELKRALAEKHAVAMEQITLGNGSNDVLELIARAFLSPGSEAIYSQYAFAVYPLVTQAIGATGRVAEARDFGHDLQAMAALVNDKTRIVFIANPNNPTGTWLKSDELEGFIRDLPNNVIVVVDEAYSEYIDLADYPDSSEWLALYPNLIVTRTFSKAYGLAGLRVGYAVCGVEIANLLNRVRQPFNVNSLALTAATIALQDSAHLQQSFALNRSGLRQLELAFDQMGLSYIPSVGNFICVDVGRTGQSVYEALLQQGVIVRPVGGYGLPNHVRVSVGTTAELERFIGALKHVLDRC